MAVTLLPGPETSIQNIDNNIRGMDANVYELEPNVSPLVSLTDAMGSQESINPKVEWLEDESMPRLTTTSGAAQGATTIPVAQDIFRVGDVVRFSAYGFGGLVTNVPAGMGGTAGAGTIVITLIGTSVLLPASAEVYLVANANAEGSTLRTIVLPQLVTQFNYDEIIRTPFGITTTEYGAQHYGGDERARLTKKFGIEHARQIENIAFFGLRSITGTTRTAGGILSYIVSNVTNDTGGLTEDDFQSFLIQGFRYGSERKTLFCSPKVVKAIEGFARGNLQVNDNVGERYGIMMKTYVSGQGQVDIVMHRDWHDSTVYNGYAILIDMDAIGLRPLRLVGSTRLLKDRQAPDYDGFKDEYRSETCIQVKHERRHALLTGVT